MAEKLVSPMSRQAGPLSTIAGLGATRRRVRWEAVLPYLYILPALLSVGIWVYRPLVQTLELSFFQWNMLPTSPRLYVGWENYQRILELPEMRKALVNTALYILGMLPFSVVLPLLIAIVTHSIVGRLRDVSRFIIFTPMVMAPVVVAIIWRWMLSPNQGILNSVLNTAFNIPPIDFFRSPGLAIWSIMIITGWKLLGFSTLIFSAGLTGINRDYMEAASIDGATGWQIVRYITLPLISPTIMLMVTLDILFAGQWTFATINVLTDGGPLDATTNIYYVLWQFGFRSLAVGWSSAAAMLFLIVFGVIAWLCQRMSEKVAFYDS